MPEPGPELFRLDGVCVEAEGRRILDGIDLVLPSGCLTVLGGRSGAGKSSLLRLLNRLDVPTEGTIQLRGTELGEMEPTSLRRDVAMVFQQPPLFPGSVADNLRVVSNLDEPALESALEAVGLPSDCLDQEAATLSGGEAQRLCFARALLSSPTVLLADEPTSALDNVPKRGLEELGRTLVESGLAVVWVSHDPGQIRRLADHLVVLDHGRLVGQGSVDELADDPDPVIRAVLDTAP